MKLPRDVHADGGATLPVRGQGEVPEVESTSQEECRGPYGHDFSAIARRLGDLGAGRVVFVANPGNAGDCIITTGTFEFFRRIGLAPEIGHWRGTYPDAHIVYGGGGNLIPIYHHGRRFIERHVDTCRSFTLLPHSVRGNEELLARLDDRFALFARERETFAHLERHAPGARIAFSHDMALANDFGRLDRLPREVEAFRLAPPPGAEWRRQVRSLARWRVELMRRRWHGSRPPADGRVLNAFRTDDERTGGAGLPAGNVDLSEHFAFSQDASPFMALRIAQAFVAVIGRFEVVRTDRLHVALTAGMLGKTVEMGDNSYGKLRLVCEHSMSDFRNMRFL